MTALTPRSTSLSPQALLSAPASSVNDDFDLAQPGHRGKSATAVITALTRHLIDNGRTSGPAANVAACQWLAKAAPEFLLKDIPASVTVGSISWVQMAIATARVEADSPGRSSTMSYADVMAYAEGKTNGADIQSAQRKALTQWGLLNGWLNDVQGVPTETDMERLRNRYNEQVLALTAAADGLYMPLPSRRELALDTLKRAFPTLDASLFEAKVLQKVWLNPGRPGAFPGLYSMLDIVMEGAALEDREHWVSKDSRVPAEAFCKRYESGKLNAASMFKAAYDEAITSLEDGHVGLAKYLMCTLAPQDRANLEYGELEFFHTNEFKIAGDLFTPPSLHERGHTLHIKATLGGKVNVYELDTRSGTLKKHDYLASRYTPPYTARKMESRNANILSRTVQIDPLKDAQPGQNAARPQPANPRLTEPGGRFDYIAKVFANSLDLRNDDLLQQARGVTAFDEGRASDKAIGEFFLNLIPLRSAIINFCEGRYAEGAFDLALDVVGLVTLGAGKVAQAGKAFSKGITSIRGAARAVRFVGASTIEAFNPLSGLGDVLVGGAGLLRKGSRPLVAAGVDNALYQGYKVSEANIAGLTRNSQGVYVSADGHVSHIRHIDDSGQAAVYEVREITRTPEGAVQARIYSANRQTPLLVQHVQGDQWMRLGALGGNPPSVASDLGPMIGGGSESRLYESLDGVHVYKETRASGYQTVPGYFEQQAKCLNEYYGEGFAVTLFENGRGYLKMKKIDGVALDDIAPRSLPPQAKAALDEMLADLLKKEMFPNDVQLSNFMYSAKENKVYPVDFDFPPQDILHFDDATFAIHRNDFLRDADKLRAQFRGLIA